VSAIDGRREELSDLISGWSPLDRRGDLTKKTRQGVVSSQEGLRAKEGDDAGKGDGGLHGEEGGGKEQGMAGELS